MMAGVQSPEGPHAVQAVRKGVINYIDVPVLEKVVIAGMYARDALPGGKSLSTLKVTRSNCQDLHVRNHPGRAN
jgi:hypothetical protein